ncbi:MAG: amidinotransferase [Planctomycetota bacterium]|nr:MAG: amidinotransferase [Planctomycetota bacterium]
MPLHARLADWPRRPGQLPATQRPARVLLADPGRFDIAEVQNVHMAGADGRPRRVDRSAARRQWQALADAYRSGGVAVDVLPAVPGLPDLCFTANPSLYLPLPGGGGELWLARMTHPSRRPEVEQHAAYARARGYVLREMPARVTRFEGSGDGVVHPGRFLLHAGIGARTERAAWEALAAAHPELDILLYALADERFYHLDTALAPLDERSALLVPQAFDRDGLELARAAFPDAIEVPLDEALRFAANAHCPDGRHVLIQRGCARTEAALRERGFTPVPLETGEFIKSGGSVFCLKQAL